MSLAYRARLFASGIFLSACIATFVGCSASAPIPPDDLLDNNPQPQKKTPKGTGTTEVKEADASVPDEPAVCKTSLPNNRCGLDPQCGCGANETCDVTTPTTGATSCVTGGGATLGRPCTATGDCVAGLTCNYGACRPYCTTPRSKCGIGGTDLCVEMLGDDSKPLINKAVCTINCDPRVPSAVCGTNACEWFADYYKPNKVSDCNFGGTMAAYASGCETTSECVPGTACQDHPTYGLECEPWCRILKVLGDPDDCGAGYKCTDVFGADAPEIGGYREGLCQ